MRINFESTCYHPVAFNEAGDCLPAKLRPGNVHSAEDWAEVLSPEIDRQQELGEEVLFRADAAFAKPEIYETLEEYGVKYAIRLVKIPIDVVGLQWVELSKAEVSKGV